MDGFHTFSTANRKKFLQNTKKGKDPNISSKTINTINQKDVVKIQTHIRKFLSMNRAFVEEFQLDFLVDHPKVYSNEQLVKNLRELLNGNKILFNRVHRIAIMACYNQEVSNRKSKETTEESNRELLKLLREVSYRIGPIFKILTNKQKKYWICNVLQYNPNFSFQIFNQKQLMQIHRIITNKYEIFIQLAGSLPKGCDLMEELINLICKYPAIQGTTYYSQEEPAKLSFLLLNTFYENIMTVIQNKNIIQVGKFPLFMINCLKITMDSLYSQSQILILAKYKIDPKYLKAEGEFLQEIIQQKPQWQQFMDFLNLSNNFNFSVFQWYLKLETFDQFLKVSDFLSAMLRLIPIQIPLHLTQQNLMACFIKLSSWVKVHEITTDQDQQKILYPLLMLIDRSIYRMTDKQFIAMIKKQGEVFEKILKDKLTKIIYKIILINKSNPLIEKITKICIYLLEEIYNRIFRTEVMSTQIFVNETMSKKLLSLAVLSNDSQISTFLTNFPFVFPLKIRVKRFKDELNRSHYYYYDEEEYGYIGTVKIRRNYQFVDAFNQLKKKNLQRGFQVMFIDQFGEQQRGVDAGGLTKQFINRVLKAVFAPQFGMFLQNSQKQLLPHPQKAQVQEGIIAQYYEFIGKMIGKALYEGITIGPKFCGPFLNAIIGMKNSFDDLRKIDKQLYNSLVYIKTMEQDARDLQLTFQYKDQVLKKMVNLKKSGHKIKVTNENKEEYVSLLANYKVNKLLEFQSRHIRKGLKSVINSSLLFMFNYEELNYLISGSGEIKIYDLKQYVQYEGYNIDSKTIRMFWEVVEEFDEENKSKLLMFVTSCPRPSFFGFSDMNPPFTIIKTKNVDSLPVAHTCSNKLELPDYQNLKVLETKLKMAINSNSGFYIA